MAPAHERLEPVQLASRQRDQRLQMQLQLAVRDRPAELVLHGEAPEDAGAQLRVEDLVAAAAALLGAVHGHVRVAQQRVGVRVARVGDDDPDAGAHEQLAPADDDRPLELRDQALGERGDREDGAGAVAGDHELVAAEARHDVAAADALAQTLRDDAQQLVARAVAERVVDDLEAIEVHQQQRDLLALALRGGERLRDVRVEERAVRQTGQRIVQRARAHLGLRVGAVERGGEHVRDRLDEAHVLRPELRAQRGPEQR